MGHGRSVWGGHTSGGIVRRARSLGGTLGGMQLGGALCGAYTPWGAHGEGRTLGAHCV